MFRVTWTLGDFVRKLRADSGWNQQELADRAKVHKSAIVRLEAGGEKSERATIERVCRALDVPISDLYAHVEQAKLFSELTGVQRGHVIDLERRLAQKNQAQGHQRDARSLVDRDPTDAEAVPPVRVRKQR